MLRICSALVLILLPFAVSADIYGRVRVIDADTIDVGAVRIRLHAIDAPEKDQACQTKHGKRIACGAWVTEKVTSRFDGKRARCTALGTDKYRRTIAKCRVGGVDLGQEIVAQGWAFAYRRYGMDYDLDEKAAFVAGRGLHGLSVQSPEQFRQVRAPAPVSDNSSCLIKGNISGNGYIYHVPGQEFYETTRINTARGERWFCSPAEAHAAGWRPARR
jgi:endonuclease YncB( thermonuclease family)